MTDIKYEITKVKKSYIAMALWRAVYFRIAPAETHDHHLQMVESVQKQWRAVAAKLRTAEAPGFDGLNLQYARNCPPLGVITKNQSRPCSKSKVCPFCFGRRVVYNVFHRVQLVLFSHNQAQESKPELDLVECSRKDYFKTVQEALIDIDAQRDRERNRIDHTGSVFVTTIAPSKENGVVVRRRGLLVTPRADNVIPDIEGAHVRRRGQVNRQQLVQFVGHATAYPVEFFRAEPELTAEFLRQIAGRRQTSFSGVLYRKPSKT